jgi:hypothetical protein
MKKKTAHKSTTTRKTTAKAAAPAQAIEQRENWYSPELAEWVACSNGEEGVDRKRNSFIIREETPEPFGCGMQVATVDIPARFSEADAAKIALLMTWAPQLWQHLRTLAPCALEFEHFEEFNEAVLCLWSSAERYPFEHPQPHHQDDEIALRVNQCRGRFIANPDGSRTPALSTAAEHKPALPNR